MKKTSADFSFEKKCQFKLVAGVDEAGRGPLCGPVVAAAVIFPDFNIDIPIKIDDSKKMSDSARMAAEIWIKENTIWAIAHADVSEIDELNILWASMLAMERAINLLSKKPEYCLIDGNRLPKNLDVKSESVVRGDSKSLSIAAASILAKQARDEIMKDLSKQFPEYGWDKNAGYGTKQHMAALDKFGVNIHHRKTYKPIKERIKDEDKKH